jgi:hypothetical protein
LFAVGMVKDTAIAGAEIGRVSADSQDGEAENGAADDRRGEEYSIGFLIDTNGAWMQLGTPEADFCIAQTAVAPTLETAIDSDGFISAEFQKTLTRIELNPATVSHLALASLRPRLAVVDLPVVLTLRASGRSPEQLASGIAAMHRIETVVKAYGDLAFDRFAASVPIVGRHSARTPAIGSGLYVVSHAGEWFTEDDARLLDEIGFSDPAIDAIGYAIRNLGFVRVSFNKPGLVAIELHPRNCDPAAIQSVAKRIQTIDLGRFEVRHLVDDGWVADVFPTGTAAVAKIRALCGFEIEAKPRDRWHLTTVTPAALSEPGSDSLRLMHQKWRISFGAFSESVFAFAMRYGLLDRFLLAAARRPGDDLVFRYIGDDFRTFYSDEFRFNAIGKSITQQPDKEYGEWVNTAYKSVTLTGMPRVDYIDAYLPGSSRGPWIRYERLLLPWRMPTGEVLVSVTSRIKSDRMLKRPA